MPELYDLANLYVASLRSLVLIEYNAHWLAAGDYSKHLLFQRLFEQATEDSDMAAERMIGLFGEKSVSLAAQAKLIGKILAKYQDEGSLLQLCLKMEKDLIAFSEQFYSALEKADQLSLGCDDMVMSLSSNRETACYLLQQALAEEED